MLLDILRYPNPGLKKKCRSIKKVDDKINKLINNMFETMYVAPGVGLAAPQVGELIRLIVVDVGNNPIALINPEIIKKAGKQVFMEGCLCLPGIEAPVERASSIVVKGLDRQGKPVKYEAEGLLATVFQHEVDHLDGHVFIDRVKDPSLIRFVENSHEKKEEII